MSRFPRILPVLCALGGALIATTACWSGERPRAEDEWARSVPLAAGGRLTITNENGSIEATPATGGAVEIVAKRSARARTREAAEALLRRIELQETASDGNVSIHVVPPRELGSATEVDFRVRVPGGVAVDLRTANGAITLRGLDGPVRAETTNGAVRGEALATERIAARSTNGAVDVALERPLGGDGEVALETVNGRVALALPAASHAHVRARTTNGSVRAEGEGLETATRSRRRVEATLNGGGARVELETVNGAARVTARAARS